MALTYEDIRGPFLDELGKDKQAQELLALINAGEGTYATASEYAAYVGDCLARVLREYAPTTDISEWDLENLIPQSLGLDHSIVSEACERVQMNLYSDAGLGMKYVTPAFDTSRAYGIVTELRNNPEFVNIADTFYDQIANFSQNVVDESIRTNASVLSRATGISSRVIRIAEHGACPWCLKVAGNYDYEDVKGTGNDVWRRHENCRCTIDYVTERNGRNYTERVNNQVRTEFVEPADQTRQQARTPAQSSNIRRLTESERNMTSERQDSIYQSALRLMEYQKTHPNYQVPQWALDALEGR